MLFRSMGSGWGVAGGVHVVCAPGAANRILGYVLYDDISDRCRVAEVGGTGDDVNGAIVRFLGRRAVQLRREWVTASVPGDHPFAIFCRSLGYRDETRYPRNGGPMGRAIDLTRFLTALAPELTSRWPHDAPQQLSMCVGDESVSLTRRGGAVSVRPGASGRRLKVADSALPMQLAMGYRDADDAPGAEGPATPEAVSKEATLESQATEKMQEIAVEAIAEIVETVKEESNSFTNSDVGASAIKQSDNASRSSKWSKSKEVPVEEQTQEEPAEEDALEEEKPEGEATEEEAAEDKTPAI